MKPYAVILLHAGYWLIYVMLVGFLALAVLQGQRHGPEITHFIFRSPATVFFFVPGVMAFYCFYTFLFSKFLYRKKIALLVTVGMVTALLSGFISLLVLVFVFGQKFVLFSGITTAVEMTIVLGGIGLIHGIIGLVMRGFISWYGDIKLKEELNRKNYEMELSLIKAQINPHFLFNTINNIDVLILKDAVKASEYLNKLSDMMRFMLYDSKPEKIALQQELAYIGKYVELQKIRTANPDYIQYHASGEAGTWQVEPMLLIPFVENAFKHAENKKVKQAVNIAINITPTQLQFVCKNSYVPYSGQIKPVHSGLGNELISRRLALLYPHRHQLQITTADGFYTVNLQLSKA